MKKIFFVFLIPIFFALVSCVSSNKKVDSVNDGTQQTESISDPVKDDNQQTGTTPEPTTIPGGNTSEIIVEEKEEQYKIFLMAQETGYTGSYEEWLESIKGDYVVLTVEDNQIKWKYSKESNSNYRTLLDLSVFKQETSTNERVYIGTNGSLWVGTTDTGIKVKSNTNNNSNIVVNELDEYQVIKENGEYYLKSGETKISFPVSNDLKYTLSDDLSYYILTGIGNYEGDYIHIPKTINDKPVKVIQKNAFINSKIKVLLIEGNVTEIQENAFESSTDLCTVQIDSKLETLANNAFYGCKKLDNIKLPSTIKKIGQNCILNTNYYNNKNNWVNGRLLYLDNYLFKVLDTSIETIEIKEGITNIASDAFSQCGTVRKVTLPSSLEIITDNLFNNCRSLENIMFSKDSLLDYVGENAFSGCSSLTNIIIPNSVTSIGQSAFSNCISLKSITLPFVGDKRHVATDSYQYPLGYIFGTSSSIGGTPTTQYYYGSSTTNTTYSTYYIPSTLKEVIITDCEYIQYGAFYNCSKLTSITITNSVTSIGGSAFYNCSSIENVYYDGTIEDWCNITFSSSTSNPMCYVKNLYILDENGDIEYGNKKYSLLTELIIPNSVTSIGNYAFYNCSSLTSIKIPNSVTSIGGSAFFGCSKLESITLPFVGGSATNNTYLGYIFGASSYSNNLSYIPTSLKEVIISEGCTSIVSYAFYNCSSITSITIPNSVTSIGSYAFYNCSSITNITIPNSVTSIGSYAFYNCSKLTSITIPNSVTSIVSYAFYNCTSLVNINFDGTINQWNAISKGTYWNKNVTIKKVKCKDGTVSL